MTCLYFLRSLALLAAGNLVAAANPNEKCVGISLTEKFRYHSPYHNEGKLQVSLLEDKAGVRYDGTRELFAPQDTWIPMCSIDVFEGQNPLKMCFGHSLTAEIPLLLIEYDVNTRAHDDKRRAMKIVYLNCRGRWGSKIDLGFATLDYTCYKNKQLCVSRDELKAAYHNASMISKEHSKFEYEAKQAAKDREAEANEDNLRLKEEEAKTAKVKAAETGTKIFKGITNVIFGGGDA